VKTRRYSEGQVIRILQEVDGGKPVVIAARDHGVSRATIHRWKARYGGMTLTELKRLKALEEENARLKRIVAQQAVDLTFSRRLTQKTGKPSRQEVSGEVPCRPEEVF
jgi:putative transposase